MNNWRKLLFLRGLLPERRGLRWLMRIYMPIAVLTIVCFISALLPPDKFWLAGFLVFATPIFLMCNLVFVIIFLLASPAYSVAPVVLLIVGWPHVKATLAWNRRLPDGELKVLSMNVETFRGYARHTPERIIMAHSILQYLCKSTAGIMCLQEYYDKPNSYMYSTRKRIKKAGFNHEFYSKTTTYDKASTVGMVIFSRYPFIKTGVLYKPDNNNNQIIWADVKSPIGIIRVYSLHLESIKLKAYEMDMNNNKEEVKRNIVTITGKLRSGFIRRAAQFRLLLDHADKSPYPVLLCGDFNEVPYSYVYNSLKVRYQSAFEEAGRGFGFTFNGMIPFLRIDNQFADSKLSVKTFSTNYDMTASDHFPLEASYSLNE